MLIKQQKSVFLKNVKTVVNSEINLSINGESIETVDDFTYLGINFTYTGNMKNAVKMLQDQALKAYCSLLSIFDRVQLDIKSSHYLTPWSFQFSCMAPKSGVSIT